MPHDTTPHFVRRTFLTGLLILIPLFVTYVLIAFLFHLLTNASAPVMHGVFRLLGLDRYPWDPLVPLMNLLLSLAVIFLLGLVGTNILGRRLLHMVDALMLRLPLVRRVYGAVKHVVDTFQGPHRSFPRVVLIEYPRQGLWTMGLVAAERGDTLHLTPSPSVLTVYIPTPPNPTSGVLVMVAAEDVMDVEYSIEEALTFIVSFGIVGKPLQRSSSSPATPPRPRPPMPPQPTRTGRNTVIPRPCASWAKDEGGCRRRAPRCRAAAAVWSLQTIVRILVYVVLFRCPPAVVRGLGVSDGVLAGPARGPTSLPGGVPRGACGCAVAILPLW